MSEEEFLARWSRRKREASTDKQAGKQDAEAPTPSELREPRDAALPQASDENTAKPQQFDLSSLPPIDSISAATDVAAFLHKGVPQELMRAALRRAWVADPAIRDFIGLAENAWDFNDPNAMPGFGPLDCTEAELGALVDRVVGGMRKVVEDLPDLRARSEDSAPRAATAGDTETEPAPMEAVVDERSTVQSAAPELLTEAAAVQPGVVDGSELEGNQARPRGHGGALPR